MTNFKTLPLIASLFVVAGCATTKLNTQPVVPPQAAMVTPTAPVTVATPAPVSKAEALAALHDLQKMSHFKNVQNIPSAAAIQKQVDKTNQMFAAANLTDEHFKIEKAAYAANTQAGSARLKQLMSHEPMSPDLIQELQAMVIAYVERMNLTPNVKEDMIAKINKIAAKAQLESAAYDLKEFEKADIRDKVWATTTLISLAVHIKAAGCEPDMSHLSAAIVAHLIQECRREIGQGVPSEQPNAPKSNTVSPGKGMMAGLMTRFMRKLAI